MLSDQVFLHEAGHYVISSKNRSDEFLTPFLLKFLLSGKQAREIAAQAATKLVSQLDGGVSDNLKAKIEEKIKGKPTFNNILWSFAKLSCMTNYRKHLHSQFYYYSIFKYLSFSSNAPNWKKSKNFNSRAHCKISSELN